MYCSGCGSQIQAGLNYCNRCGRRAADDKGGLNLNSINPTVIAAFMVGIGFIAFIFVMLALVKNGVTGSDLVGITAFYFAGLFGISFVLLRQMRLYANEVKTNIKSEATADHRVYLSPVNTAQLPEPNERPASVTEHTTRTLDQVTIDRN